MYKIMVAEDEDIIRKGLIYSIPWSDISCSVIAEVCNGIEGIKKINECKPDIIIVDINMPVVDGLEMINRTYKKCDYVAIILSGYSNFEYAQKAIRFGVTGYLLKPLDVSELKGAILRAQKECELRHAYLNKERTKDEWKHFAVIKNNKTKQTEDAVVKQMLNFVKQHYRSKIVIKDVVNYLNYSETFLNKRFKAVMGTTFIEYLNRYRIQKALELLNKGNNKIQDIAWKCGIGDYKYFGTVFKKYIGCSPKEYLAEINNL